MLRRKTTAFQLLGSKGERMPTDLQQQAQEQVEEKPLEALPTSDKPAEEPEELALPDDVSERTKEQFDKLKEHNRQLKEQLEQVKPKEQLPSVLDSLRPPATVAPTTPPVAQNFSHLNQQQVDSVYSKMVDDQGYVDIDRLNSELEGLNNRILQAERSAKQAQEELRKREENEKVRKVYEHFPQLDPNQPDKFDRRFYSLVRNEMIGQMMNGKEDFLQAAQTVSELLTPKAAEEKKADPSIEAVKHINATGNRSVSTSPVDMQRLVDGTRRGAKGALAERLRRSGY